MKEIDKKAAAFRALHRPGAPFVMPNPWNAGTARLFAGLGAAALATTSSGMASALGREDMGHVSRDEALAHAAAIAAATPLPVSADLENGFGDTPQTVAETVRLAAETGVIGCSIEDTVLPSSSPYSFTPATDRIAAAVAAAKKLPYSFVLTARADGVMLETYGEEEAIRRLLSFAEAGAEVLYAPYLSPPALTKLCKMTQQPVNALALATSSDGAPAMTLSDFAKAGVARVSIGGGLARLAQTAVCKAARTILTTGDFSSLAAAMSEEEIDVLLKKGGGN